jgi:hypothetical protein
VIVGLVLIIVSFVLALVNFSTESELLSLMQIITHHVGLILALVGLLLSQPLGN